MARLSELKLDKLSLTLPIENEVIKEGIRDYLSEAAHGQSSRIFPVRSGARYGSAFQLRLTPEESCNIQIDPYRRGHNYMRLEFNPAKLGESGCSVLREFLEGLLGTDYTDAIRGCRITSIHFAIDLYRLNIENISVFKRTRVGSHAYFTEEGKLSSLTLGSLKGGTCIYIYDKEREQRDKGRPSIATPKTRIEIRLRPKCSPQELQSIANLFDELTIVEYRSLSDFSSEHAWIWFLDSCRTRGTTAALALISDPKTRRRWANRIREIAPPAWWNPTAIWDQLGDALSRVQLFNIDVS